LLVRRFAVAALLAPSNASAHGRSGTIAVDYRTRVFPFAAPHAGFDRALTHARISMRCRSRVRVPSLPLGRRKSARFSRMMTFDGRPEAAAAAGAHVARGGGRSPTCLAWAESILACEHRGHCQGRDCQRPGRHPSVRRPRSGL